jgi:Tol biopolymer transport system component
MKSRAAGRLLPMATRLAAVMAVFFVLATAVRSGWNRAETDFPNYYTASFERDLSGPRQIWLRNMASGDERQLTGGNCNSGSPPWELDSRAIVFSGDCGRGIGLLALYRAEIEKP